MLSRRALNAARAALSRSALEKSRPNTLSRPVLLVSVDRIAVIEAR
jgi:hypothetical protein